MVQSSRGDRGRSGEREQELRLAGFARGAVVFRPGAQCWPGPMDTEHESINGFVRRRGNDIDVGDPAVNGGALDPVPAGVGIGMPLFSTFSRTDVARIDWAERENYGV